ncbi:MAG: ABC transporter ATP-binding protein [Phycisphaerae bacterium]|nr:ABC transporter ATP-binding protein [Phycisphaerae bacterium]
MIRIEGLCKSFGRAVAIEDVSFTVPTGDAVALWGINGAGKSTVIRCVLGLFRFRGQIEVGGCDVRRQGKRARQLIGYVPQELGFYDDLRVGEAIRFFARLKGVSSSEVDDVLDRVSLGGQAAKRVRELSGGMKQRLALAIALIGNPPILVLDEVTASLDACGREEFVALLGQLSEGGRTLLFASHRVDEVTTLAKRVITLDRGKIAHECLASEFVPQLGLGTLLHFHLSPQVCDAAMTALRASGFAPRPNGVGLLVPVPSEQKAAPFRVLADARISIDDFEVIATSVSGSKTATQHTARERESTP